MILKAMVGAATVLIVALGTAGGLSAQEAGSLPAHTVVVSGYGTTGWTKSEGLSSGFFSAVSPILLFQMSDKVFAEAELEFELEDGATETGLEYATVHYFASDRVILSAGKFLLPFGVFSQRLHPSWINRFASTPPFVGSHGGVVGNDPLLPILADIGVMASAVVPLSGIGRSVTLTAYLTNGPRMAEAGHDEAEPDARPNFGFGAASGDNNANKMVGGRIGLVLGAKFEAYASVLAARWGTTDEAEPMGTALGLRGYNLAAEYRPTTAVELRTEWVWWRTQIEEELADGHIVATVPQLGGYLQATYRRGPWEPVGRLSLVNQDQRGSTGDNTLKQLGLGVNYWLSPSVVLKTAYEVNKDTFDQGRDLANNRFLIQWAYGF